jgi:hypothetical protein
VRAIHATIAQRASKKEPGAIRIAGIAMIMRSRQASGLHALSLSEKGVKIYEIGQVAAQQCELD